VLLAFLLAAALVAFALGALAAALGGITALGCLGLTFAAALLVAVVAAAGAQAENGDCKSNDNLLHSA
jgi:hypothetical protein